MECVQQSQDKFKQSIVEKHKEVEEEAAQLIEQIQTEISELEQRGAEMEQLWSSGDHLHFVQTFTSVKPAPQLNDWTEETVRAPSDGHCELYFSEEQFLCSICLEIFTAPVTTPCGHNFCDVCINKHWNSSRQYNCPVCKQDFSSRPQIQVNTFISEMVSQLPNKTEVKKQSALSPSLLLQERATCSPTSQTPRLKKHQLIQPLSNLEERICPDTTGHWNSFCREHSHLICWHCTSEDHKDHQTFKKEVREMPDTEIQEGLKVFNAVMECVQQKSGQVQTEIVEKHKKNEEEAAQLIEQIQTEIYELEQRGAEMEQLWSSGDHLHFVQTFTSVNLLHSSTTGPRRLLEPHRYKGRAAKAVSELKNMLNSEIDKVKGKTAWELGVAKESVDRIDEVSQTVQKGHWLLYMAVLAMATVSCTFSEEQFLCSICLEIFTAPVTTPCGHNFCDVCINKHWNSSLQYNCPVCKQDLPQDHRFKKVDCDLCPEPRLRALKSCLVCLASYCQSHLQPHLTNPRLKKHQLIKPLSSLEERICPEHDRTTGTLLQRTLTPHMLALHV
ncbi:hypothetical protein WMY93_027197 [Mugilogobius chulae]|uniref:RING-type domain-containing protein n=1 Tax=Mugilogobius chulae TaxID=88201 RepID=A0AAW0N4H9_9GOBI